MGRPKTRKPVEAPLPPYPDRADHPDPVDYYRAVQARVLAVQQWEEETGKRAVMLTDGTGELICSPAEATALIRDGRAC